jgi:hypothetical protein
MSCAVFTEHYPETHARSPVTSLTHLMEANHFRLAGILCLNWGANPGYANQRSSKSCGRE